MSDQKFTPEERYAFWRAYAKRCYLCSQPLTLREVRLDHIVPEKVSETTWSPVRKRLGLPEFYNRKDYENVALTCHPCNSLKRDSLLADGILSLQLAVAAKCAQSVRTILEENRKKSREELAKAYLTLAKQNDISAQDLREAALKASRTSEYSLNTIYLERIIPLVVNSPDNEELHQIENKSLFETDYAIPLNDVNGRVLEVKTIAEYRNARRLGYSATNTLEHFPIIPHRIQRRRSRLDTRRV